MWLFVDIYNIIGYIMRINFKETLSSFSSFLYKNQGWIFPIIVLSALISLSTLQISGTSAGIYDYLLGKKPVNLIAGKPRPIRSDEWVVTTPFTVSQYNNGMPAKSKDIGIGQDMSIVADAPYTDWSMLFRPHNLIFFLLPIGFAFAFKWWLLSAGLALSVYIFVLFLYPRKYLVASLLGSIMLFSPFIQWWYQSATILPIIYGLLGIVSVVKLIESRCRRTAIYWSIALAYLAVCFALVMYPAFQLTIGLVSLVTMLAILQGRGTLHLLWQRRNLFLIFGSIILAGTIMGLFLWQHSDAVKASLNTIYPGNRNISSGGFDVFRLISWPLSYLLLDDNNLMILGNNQSEVSNFLLIGLVLVPFLIYLSIRYKSTFSKLEKSIIYISSGIFIFIAIRMLIPIGDQLFSLLGVSKIPHERLFIGLGLINFLLLLVAVSRRSKKLPKKWWKPLISIQQLIFLAIITIIFSILIYATVRHYNIPNIGPLESVAVILAFSVSSTLLLSSYEQLRIVGLVGVLLLNILSTYMVNPLYRGVGITDNEFSRYIMDAEKKDNFYWVANDSSVLSAIMVASGAEVYGGVNTYPQTDVWRRYFPNSTNVFNRYAHVRFLFDSSPQKRSLSLIQDDSFFVHISPCDEMLHDLNIRYIASERPLKSSCLESNRGRIFDGKRIYIYTIKNNSTNTRE